MSERERERALAIAESTRQHVLRLFDALDADALDTDEFTDAALVALLAGIGREVTLADVALAVELGRLPLGLLPPPAIDTQIATALDTVLRYDQPMVRVGRMAHAMPLESWQQARGEGIERHRLPGWTRRTGPDPCPICKRLANGDVLPPKVRMRRPHPTCSCFQAVVP